MSSCAAFGEHLPVPVAVSSAAAGQVPKDVSVFAESVRPTGQDRALLGPRHHQVRRYMGPQYAASLEHLLSAAPWLAIASPVSSHLSHELDQSKSCSSSTLSLPQPAQTC